MWFDEMCNHDYIQCVIAPHKQKCYSKSNKSKKSSLSKDNSNKKLKSQHADAYGVIKEMVQNYLLGIVTF